MKISKKKRKDEDYPVRELGKPPCGPDFANYCRLTAKVAREVTFGGGCLDNVWPPKGDWENGENIPSIRLVGDIDIVDVVSVNVERQVPEGAKKTPAVNSTKNSVKNSGEMLIF